MRDVQFAKRLTAVDEHSRARHRRSSDAPHGKLTGFRVAPVYADGEDQIEGLLAWLEHEALHGCLPDAHPAGGDLGGGILLGLGDRLGRPVDGQDVAGDQPSGYRSCCPTRTATDLED